MLAFPMLLLALAMADRARAVAPECHHRAGDADRAARRPHRPCQHAGAEGTAFIEAARATGCSDTRIILRHILPNTFAPLLVIATAYLGLAIVQEAALDYLGAGIQEPEPSWGLMMSGSATSLALVAPWIVIFPGLAICLDGACFKSSRRRHPRRSRSQAATRLPVTGEFPKSNSQGRSRMSKSVLHTSLCDDLKIEYPVFLAGMGVKGHATPPDTGGGGERGRRHGHSRAARGSTPTRCAAASARCAI